MHNYSSNKMLTMVMNNIPQHVFWKDLNLVFVGCNDNFAKAVGLSSPAEIVGKTDFDIADETKANYFRETDKKVLKDKKPIYNILECHKDLTGEDVWMNVNKIPLFNEEGVLVGILGTFEDVSKTVKMSNKIKYSEEKYRALINFTNTAYIIMEISGLSTRIIEANDNFVRLMKFSSLENIIGEDLRKWININDIPEFDHLFADLINNKKSINNFECGLVIRGEETIDVELTVNIMENGIRKIFCLIRDLSYKRNSKDKIRIEQQRKKDKMLQKIQEIRNDIRNIIS